MFIHNDWTLNLKFPCLYKVFQNVLCGKKDIIWQKSAALGIICRMIYGQGVIPWRHLIKSPPLQPTPAPVYVRLCIPDTGDRDDNWLTRIVGAGRMSHGLGRNKRWHGYRSTIRTVVSSNPSYNTITLRRHRRVCLDCTEFIALEVGTI